jgi:hypothetical protein
LLREFLLDQILLLQEPLQSCLVPRAVEELLGTKLPPLAKDTLSPLAVEGKVAEGCSVVVCAPSPSSGSASVLVHDLTGAQVLLLPSQLLEIKSSSVQVVLP